MTPNAADKSFTVIGTEITAFSGRICAEGSPDCLFVSIFLEGRILRPSPPAASSFARLSSRSLECILFTETPVCPSSGDSCLRPCCDFRLPPFLPFFDAGPVPDGSGTTKGSVATSLYLSLDGLGFDFALGGLLTSGASTRTTRGPLSFTGLGFFIIGPAGTMGFGSGLGSGSGSGIGSSGALISRAVVSVSASVLASGSASDDGLVLGFGFLFTRTFLRSTRSETSTVVLLSPSENHSRIVAARPAEIVDI